jgi:hypothetical protein
MAIAPIKEVLYDMTISSLVSGFALARLFAFAPPS